MSWPRSNTSSRSPYLIPPEAVADEDASTALLIASEEAIWWSIDRAPQLKTASNHRRMVVTEKMHGKGNVPVPLTTKDPAGSRLPLRGLKPEASPLPPPTQLGSGRATASPPLVYQGRQRG
ncbi:hypothetical protein RHMOL_Rhmol03G0140900 [Rhododendron molle]|uniref:Uncharacterized protein n=1 Tax=Rhododendron molle TaxID=49168 RepID=A0ACC0PFK2_RHOML|nr:hypothetical protein RHMOL_Rhmol03G0140900 [Rhododendron molle]